MGSLQIRVAQLETAAANDDSSFESAATAATTAPFKKGDRVIVKNKLKRPAVWPTDKYWDKELAQRATVTHIVGTQVHFVTDNGVKTWRAVNNLELTR